MATGTKAFAGKSQASLIGSIIIATPPPVSSTSRPMTPPAFDRVVKTCLAKDPEDRFQTAHDVRLQLQWIAEGGSQAGLPAPVAARRKSRERLAWAVAAAAIAAAALLGAGYLRRAPVKASADPLRDPDSGRSLPDRRPQDLARREASRVQRQRFLRPTPHLGAAVERSDRAASGRDRRSRPPLLVARQPLPRLLRRRQAEEDRGLRRPPAEDLRLPDGRGRHAGARRA